MDHVNTNESAGLILLTGTTGYVGGRLRRVFEEHGQPIRCLARRPDELVGKVAAATEVVRGDVLDRESLCSAMQGVETAYYLVHSMGQSKDFAQADRRGAELFASAAAEAGVQRIVYLGGLGKAGTDKLSHHLASRHEVGKILRSGAVPVIEFRSSIILGSGSLSFELIRALVDRLPIMTTPRWVQVKTQPIAIEDVLGYLEQAAGIPVDGSIVYEIGGPSRVSYGDIMREYASQRGLRRWLIPLPVLSPKLSSLWLGLITPIYARVGRELIDSVRNETVVDNPVPANLFTVKPRAFEDAIRRAMIHEERAFAETIWFDALSSSRSSGGYGGEVIGSRVVDSRVVEIEADPRSVFAQVERIGGATGWYGFDWLWSLRGFLDLLVGGVGLRRGRRDPERLAVGDPLDFWRVQAIDSPWLLRLHAEMKLPGRAWLQFEVEGEGNTSRLRQTAMFKPMGLFGLVYWYALYPLHSVIFRRMLRNMAAAAMKYDPLDHGGALPRPPR